MVTNTVRAVIRREVTGGQLLPYEDGALSVEQRVDDLIARMTLQEKAGLLWQPMLTPDPSRPFSQPPASFTGEPSLSQRVGEHHLNHFNLMAVPDDAAATVQWYNSVQELAARTRLGIPVTLSSDPRHHFTNNPALAWQGGMYSQWPEPIGFAAIGDETLVEHFADVVRREYIASGIRVALHPQADLATEPRWARASGTFGEDAPLASKLVAAYIRGLQGPELGPQSVAAMVKHFPGGGPQLDGEDPHFDYGREQVYPGGMFDHHLVPFEAAFAAGVSQVMPYYGMPVGTQYEEVGFGFNKGVITGLLREEYGFDGIVCSDWGLLTDAEAFGAPFPARAWGAEHLSTAERASKVIEAGVDQFGGEECPEVVIDLVRRGRVTEARLDVSARRLLREKFVLGLFDNPFADLTGATGSVGTAEDRQAGLDAQRRAMVVLANTGLPNSPALPITAGRVYFGGFDPEIASRYAAIAASPGEAEMAVVRVEAPYQPRPIGLQRFFHAGSLAFTPEQMSEVMAVARQAPTVVVVHLERPAVLTEIASVAAGLVGEFGASDEAVLDVVFGRYNPSGKLPFDLPSSMAEVIAQRPDVPHDMANPLYRFGHGLAYPGR